MPTYDYVCDNCGYNFEEFQSIIAEPLTNCPQCQGHVHRLISSGNGFLFKGNGFYITDYRTEKYKKERQREEGNKSDNGNGKHSSESKPAEKSKPLAQNPVKTAD